MLSRMFTRKEQMTLALFSGAIVLGVATVYVREYRDADLAERETVELIPVNVPMEVPPETESPVVVIHEFIPPPLEAQITEVVVSISGAVARPTVYRMNADARVQDLIEAAGGIGVDADMSDINLAAPLIDGSTLTLPYKTTIQDLGGGVLIERKSSKAVWNPPEYTISGWRARDGVSVESAALSITVDAGVEESSSASLRLIDLNTASQAELETLPGIGPKLAISIVQYRETTPFSQPLDLLDVPGIGPKRFEAIKSFVAVE